MPLFPPQCPIHCPEAGQSRCPLILVTLQQRERERELDYFQSTKYADPIPSSPSIMRGGPNTDHLFEEWSSVPCIHFLNSLSHHYFLPLRHVSIATTHQIMSSHLCHAHFTNTSHSRPDHALKWFSSTEQTHTKLSISCSPAPALAKSHSSYNSPICMMLNLHLMIHWWSRFCCKKRGGCCREPGMHSLNSLTSFPYPFSFSFLCLCCYARLCMESLLLDYFTVHQSTMGPSGSENSIVAFAFFLFLQHSLALPEPFSILVCEGWTAAVSTD